MRGRHRVPFVLVGLLAACAGVSPRPDAVTVESLPTSTLSGAESDRLAMIVAECVRDVVLRRYEPAERGARAALAIDPRCARARAVLGIVLLQTANAQEPPDLALANTGEAQTVLAEKLAPRDAFVGWVRALFLAQSGHLSAAAAAAEAALQRATEAPPEERAALFGLAGTYRYELGEERAALPLLQAYIGLRPDDAAASFRVGSCLLRMAMLPTGAPEKQDEIAQRQAENAARAFARCVELAPGDEDAALAVGASSMRAAALAGKRGQAAERERNQTAAVLQFRRVAEQFTESAEAMFRVGVVEEARGDNAAAQVAYEAALLRDAAHLGSLLNLAALAESAGDADRTIALLRRALAADADRGGLSGKERERIEARLAAGDGAKQSGP